jgi:hypothetical protein
MSQDIVERYVIRAGHEWAFIYVDEQTGVFSCYSSHGTYAYCWTHIGTKTLKEFLSRLNFDYFMGKTRRDYRRFDPEATVKSIKEYIIEQRKVVALDRDEARKAWADAEDLYQQDQNEFFNELCSSRPLMKVYDGDYCDIACNRPDGDSRGFWQKIWPEFLKKIAVTDQALTPADGGGK